MLNKVVKKMVLPFLFFALTNKTNFTFHFSSQSAVVLHSEVMNLSGIHNKIQCAGKKVSVPLSFNK